MMTNERRDSIMAQIASVVRPTGTQLMQDIADGVCLTKQDGIDRLAVVVVPELLKLNSGEMAELFALFLAEYNLSNLARIVIMDQIAEQFAEPEPPDPGGDPSQN